MNTVEKGDAFEERTHKFFLQQIQEDQFWARKECCQVFAKKGYYSKDRGKNIVFDVSIEITLPGESRYSVLVLIECKNYSTSVPVDDVEEFWAKVQQVAGGNVKGIFASTNAFQGSAQTFAKSKGFGLLRFFNGENFKWILTRSPSTFSSSNLSVSEAELKIALSKEEFTSTYYDCCGFAKAVYSHSVNHILEQIFTGGDSRINLQYFAFLRSPEKGSREVVKFVAKEEIEALANTSLDQTGYKEGIVNLEKICNWQQQECGLIVKTEVHSPYGDRVLGSLSFVPPRITLFKGSDQRRERIRFTLAHEIGHLILGHKEYMWREYTEESDFNPESVNVLGSKDIARMEWQANYFASCLLLPKNVVSREFLQIANELKLYNKGFGVLYVDKQPINLKNFIITTNRLKIIFRAS